MEMGSLLLDTNLSMDEINEISQDVELFKSLTVDLNLKGMCIKSGLFTLYVPMTCIPDMTPWSFRTAVTPDTVKIMKIILLFSCKSLKFPTK